MLNIFKTRETSLATYLIARGIKYIGPEEIAPGMYSFVFENPDKCYELEKEFLTIKSNLLKDLENDKNNRQ